MRTHRTLHTHVAGYVTDFTSVISADNTMALHRGREERAKRASDTMQARTHLFSDSRKFGKSGTRRYTHTHTHTHTEKLFATILLFEKNVEREKSSVPTHIVSSARTQYSLTLVVMQC